MGNAEDAVIEGFSVGTGLFKSPVLFDLFRNSGAVLPKNVSNSFEGRAFVQFRLYSSPGIDIQMFLLLHIRLLSAGRIDRMTRTNDTPLFGTS